MKVVGVIVEYNPLHYGHIHHLTKTKALSDADVVIAVMSSHAVQRGEFSVVDKFTKTKWALKAGVDLVIELPAVFALQSADLFAETGVRILDALHVDEMYFGSETGDIAPLKDVLKIMQSDAYDTLVKQYLDQGESYPTSSHLALEALSSPDVFKGPNDILGIQYIHAIDTIDSTIEPYTILRLDTGYYDDIKAGTNIQSATAIRKLHIQNDDFKAFVPSYVHKDLKHYPRTNQEAWFPFMAYKLASETQKSLQTYFGFEEGIESLFMKHYDEDGLTPFLDRVSSKRYTHAKIKRALMHMLIGIKKHDIPSFKPPYIRVLGMNKTGQAYLNKIKHDLEDQGIPLISKLKQVRHPYLDIELRVTKIYDLIIQRNLIEEEFKPVIIV